MKEQKFVMLQFSDGEPIAVVEVLDDETAFKNLIQLALEEYKCCGISVIEIDYGGSRAIFEDEFTTEKWEVEIQSIPHYTLKDL